MKEFDKWLMETRPRCEVPSWFGGAKAGWEAALKHFNGLFNDSMHPQDVIFAMQKELEEK